MTALTGVVCALFVHLGQWQLHRAEWRQAEWDAFARGADRAVALGSRGTASIPRFQRVRVSGRFDPTRQFLLDNRTQDDQAGYEVLTPLLLDSGRVLLVDRGWVPFTGYRSRLPDVHLDMNGQAALTKGATAIDGVTLTGRVDELPAPGLALGRMPPPAGPQWPKVTSYPDMAQLGAALGLRVAEGSQPSSGMRLEPRMLLLDPGEPFGYVRRWQPPGMSPERHLAYAAQWWLFAVTLVVIWAVLSTRPARRATDTLTR